MEASDRSFFTSSNGTREISAGPDVTEDQLPHGMFL